MLLTPACSVKPTAARAMYAAVARPKPTAGTISTCKPPPSGLRSSHARMWLTEQPQAKVIVKVPDDALHLDQLPHMSGPGPIAGKDLADDLDIFGGEALGACHHVCPVAVCEFAGNEHCRPDHGSVNGDRVNHEIREEKVIVERHHGWWDHHDDAVGPLVLPNGGRVITGRFSPQCLPPLARAPLV